MPRNSEHTPGAWPSCTCETVEMENCFLEAFLAFAAWNPEARREGTLQVKQIIARSQQSEHHRTRGSEAPTI